MKIQSRSVFIHRESFETILDKTEQMLLKVSNYHKYEDEHVTVGENCFKKSHFETLFELFHLFAYNDSYLFTMTAVCLHLH